MKMLKGVVMLSIYFSYLVGANGINIDDMRTGNGSFRQAYDLLYSAETMMQEAENLIESREVAKIMTMSRKIVLF